jgi:hypothetical protein
LLFDSIIVIRHLAFWSQRKLFRLLTLSTVICVIPRLALNITPVPTRSTSQIPTISTTASSTRNQSHTPTVSDNSLLTKSQRPSPTRRDRLATASRSMNGADEREDLDRNEGRTGVSVFTRYVAVCKPFSKAANPDSGWTRTRHWIKHYFPGQGWYHKSETVQNANNVYFSHPR